MISEIIPAKFRTIHGALLYLFFVFRRFLCPRPTLDERLSTGNYDSLQRYREQLDKLESERGRLINTYTKGYLSEAELNLRMRSVIEQKEYYNHEILRLESEFEGVEDTLKWIEAIPQGWNEDLTLFALMTDGELTPFFQRFLKEITVTVQHSSDDVECVFKLGNLEPTTCSAW